MHRLRRTNKVVLVFNNLKILLSIACIFFDVLNSLTVHHIVKSKLFI